MHTIRAYVHTSTPQCPLKNTFTLCMHNSPNHSMPLTVCMALTFFLCRKSALNVSNSSCTVPLWPNLAASRAAVQPSCEERVDSGEFGETAVDCPSNGCLAWQRKGAMSEVAYTFSIWSSTLVLIAYGERNAMYQL